ncbi:hydroxymethylglutaryl-CoA synthase family protein [Sulfurospirillum multivorans]|uniref:Periplasmic protein n=2 Tax=Sulfurospirillum multivorans TaxID=66821 RepID=A0AA86AMC6_SULMK|nr:hypothetical protein [Sulfurospirillum multivorans]AHJ12422.1 hypothetical protein SMUL_1156 [Sulfurospirillum multivorans DSM 12446]QEH05920.1 hypothetical protein SMN_1146 [Sulfurospirillum multivorans]
MKKILILVGLLTSMYAIPPCELPNQMVCAYLYKGAMSSEIIIVNLSRDNILVKNISATLDGQSKSISDLQLSPGQSYTMLKSRYDDHLKKPYYYIGSMDYKTIK